MDRRGHRESDTPHQPYPIATCADDVAYLVELLGLGRVIAVGHSSGGLTVLQLAAAHPQRVAGHFNQLETPDRVTSMIETFVRHYVVAPAAAV